jgi:hypothetical protein
MAVPTTMADLSTTASSNSPAGGENPISTDDFHRAIQSILRHQEFKGADIASATTTNIGAATGGFIDVTGTTTITGLGTIAAGIERTVRFTGILTLTHNGTSLILPNAANITTFNGYIAVFRSLGSGNWIMITDNLNPAASIQYQTYTAFTTGGTSSAFTVTAVPAITTYTNSRLAVTLNAAPTGSPTINYNGLGAKSFKYKDSSGTKQFVTATQAPNGYQCDCWYDGTDVVLLNPLPIVVSDVAYDATTWNGNLDAPTKNAVRDKIESLSISSFTLLGTITTTSGSSQGLTSLDLTTYKQVVCHVNDVSITAVATMNLNAIAITPSLGGAGNNFSGIVTLMLNNSQGITHIAAYTPALTVIGATSVLHNSGISTASTAITFTTSSGTFDNGSITVYGVK